MDNRKPIIVKKTSDYPQQTTQRNSGQQNTEPTPRIMKGKPSIDPRLMPVDENNPAEMERVMTESSEPLEPKVDDPRLAPPEYDSPADEMLDTETYPQTPNVAQDKDKR